MNLKKVIILHGSTENQMKNQIQCDHKELFKNTNFKFEEIEWIYSSTIPVL